MKELLFGYTAQRITAFLRKDDAFMPYGDGAWQCGSCRITVEALPPRTLSRTLRVPRTRVKLCGDAADVDAVCRRLFMQFLSVGG